MRSSAGWLAAAALCALALPAAARDARCAIATADGKYAGPCRFVAEKGGSFSVSPPKGRGAFFNHAADEPGITGVSVTLVGAEAEVRGLTSFGVNSRWGPAKRSKTDRACWIGADFSVCAY